PVPLAAAGSLLSWHMACALWQLEQLPALRARILAREIEPGEAMESFNLAIRHLLDLVPEASESVDEASLARALTALYSFMQGKELAGQERATGAIGFTQGAFSEPLRQRLADRIDGQQRCFETFLSLASADIRERFYRHGEATRELEQLRRLACTRLPADDHRARAVRWFGAANHADRRAARYRGGVDRRIAGGGPQASGARGAQRNTGGGAGASREPARRAADASA
ncbi:nitrate- and nitrite sensing domain-containing protein, partial [Cronobacter malonaticus]|uniref:nitrate- and nitrite sensing domain-containing protein n=1 Tax=Cronobacter malonaticus TaxID=413503 RepID=UPI001F27BC02